MSATRDELHFLADQLPEERLVPVLWLIRGDDAAGRRERAAATLALVQERMRGVTGAEGNWRGCVTVTVADTYVVDTGVFLRWFIDQDGFERARELQQKLIDGAVTAETVDFARVEVAGVLSPSGEP